MIRTRSRKSEKGQATAEYIIIIALVAITSIGVIAAFSDSIKGLFIGATKATGGNTSEVENKKSKDLFLELNDSKD